MFHTKLTNLGGREHLHVSVTGDGVGSVAEESRRAIETALALVAEAGYARGHIVRSRLFARDANARRVASDARVEMISSEMRAASSSYIDPARLPSAARVAVDLIALRAPKGAVKNVREYDPAIAPPMFVALDGFVYVSGCTDVSDGFEVQLKNVRSYIARNLAAAGLAPADVIHVCAHVSRKIRMEDAWRDLALLFPGLAGTISLSPVDGYSAPEKLIEIEATARAQ